MTGKRGVTIIELAVVVGIFLVMFIALTPFVHMAKARANRIACANNLMRISLALRTYSHEHDGKFPEDAGALYPDYVQDERLFDCPATRKKGTHGEPEYRYTAGLAAGSDGREIIVEDLGGNHDRFGKHVLRVDGAVEWVNTR